MVSNKNEIVESVKKSSLNANGYFDYEKLVYPMPYFLPCAYEEELEEIVFTYDIRGMRNVSELKTEEKKNQYQFLINLSKVEQLLETYKIPLRIDNVYYDENFLPYVKHRDSYAKEEEYKREDFLFLYKTFIGGILGKKYDVKSLQESGIEPLKQEKSFQDFYEAEDSSTLTEILCKRKYAYQQKEKLTMVRVTKTGNSLRTAISIIAPVLLLVTVVGLVYIGMILLPFQNSVLLAHEGYVANDYVESIDCMKTIEPSDMDISTKYILAISYAKSESLRKEELEGIISKLSLSSNEKELEYWIHLGRLEFERAENMAKALSNDKLLIYNYMKELTYLEDKTDIEGAEKESRISTLEQNIKSLGEKYSDVE